MILSATKIGFDGGSATLSMADPDPASHLKDDASAQLRPLRRILRPARLRPQPLAKKEERKNEAHQKQFPPFFSLYSYFGQLQGERVGGELDKCKKKKRHDRAQMLKIDARAQGRTFPTPRLHPRSALP